MTRQKLERRFRTVLVLFMLALVMSGITAFPLLSELRLLAETLGVSPNTQQRNSDGLRHWIGYVHEGLEESSHEVGLCTMKSISASIIVLSGAGLIVGGAFVPHSQTGVFVMFVGCVLGLAGLVGWSLTLRDTDQP
jgi:hypothetical protein